jgi:hypothetical protein
LDLKTRLFKYPCSYLIYSETFENLPDVMKERLYLRLWEILKGQDTSAAFEPLNAETRRALLEILIDTKSGLPPYWRK